MNQRQIVTDELTLHTEVITCSRNYIVGGRYVVESLWKCFSRVGIIGVSHTTLTLNTAPLDTSV